jgi:hypothetical protein
MPLWLSRYVHGRSLSLTKLGKHGQGASQQARSHHDVVPESARTIEDDAWSVRPTGKDPQILVFFFAKFMYLFAKFRCSQSVQTADRGGAFAGSPRKTNRVFQLRYAQKAHHRASLFVLHVVRRFSWDPAFCRFFYC